MSNGPWDYFVGCYVSRAPYISTMHVVTYLTLTVGVSFALIIPLSLAAFNIQLIEFWWAGVKATLKKLMLSMLRVLWIVARLKKRPHGFKAQVYRSRIFHTVMLNIAVFHSYLLKGLIAFSTSTIPDEIQAHMDYVTDPHAVYRYLFVVPTYNSLHRLVFYVSSGHQTHVREIQKSHSENEKEGMPLSEDWSSMYSDEAARDIAELQSRDTRIIAGILVDYGFPIF